MLFRILKEDLKRKKTMNLIVFLFISIAVMFLASSVTNLKIISKGVDYYLDKSNVPDYVALQSGSSTQEKSKELIPWLTNHSIVEDYSFEDSILTGSDSMSIQKKQKQVSYKQSNSSVLQRLPKKYGLVFNEKGEVFQLSNGEIAIPYLDKDKNDLALGDTLSVKVGDVTKDFTIVCFVKDSIFGTNFMGLKRFFISEDDYQELANQEGSLFQVMYMVKTDQVDQFMKDIKSHNFNFVFSFERATIKLCYLTDMLIAAILLIVSVCLILISFFVLRFTIIFTILEDYKEIGVMKAIGIKNFGIKSIYLIKYFGLAVGASFLGFFVSFPFSSMLIDKVSENILMEDTNQNPMLNVLCSIIVILLVLCFCFISMKKLDKYSAIEAIRNGSSGERFKRKGVFQLKYRRRMQTPVFIAINNITTSLRKYFVMVITFCLGTMLIIIPVNAMNTLKDSQIIRMFGFNTSDFYILNVFDTNVYSADGKEKIKDTMDQMTKQLENEGLSANLYVEASFTLRMHGENQQEVYPIVTMQNFNGDIYDDNYWKGSKPILENEMSLSEVSADHLNVDIGDTVFVEIDGLEKEFIITGLFQSMSNQGEDARINNKIDISYQYLNGLGPLQGDFINKEITVLDARNQLKHIYPEYEILSVNQFVSSLMGGIVDQIGSFKNLIVILVLCLEGLITILMIKTFVTKETPEIAMLKSIGFSNKSLRSIHIVRIGMIQIISILLGIVLSILIDEQTIGNVFRYMGARHISLTIVPFEVYVIYPVLLFAIPMLVSWFSSFMIHKIQIRNMNFAE